MSNPLFQRRGRGSKIGYAIIVLLAVGLGAFLVLSPAFRITSVRVVGTQKIDPASVERFVSERLNDTFLGLAWRRVTFLTPTETLTRELRRVVEKMISVSELRIHHEGRKTLVVTLKERAPNLVWTSRTGRSYFLDEQGFIVESLVGDVPQDFLTVHDANGLMVENGMQVLQPSFIAGLRTIKDRLASLSITPASFATLAVECPKLTQAVEETPTNSTEISNDNRNTKPPENENVNRRRTDLLRNVETEEPCDRAALALSEPTLVVVTSERWEILFNTNEALDRQIEKLSITLRERFENSRPRAYIDVRFGDRVFFQ